MTGTTAGGLLVVCRANLIRSPVAAGLLRRGPGGRREVASAGLHAEPGLRADDDTVAVAARAGVDLADHVSRPVTADLLAASALVLAMTEAQRSALVRTLPAAVPRTFTLLELVRLTGPGPADGNDVPLGGPLAEVAARAHRRRPLELGPGVPEDVPDPVGRGPQELRAVVARLVQACDRLTGYDAAGYGAAGPVNPAPGPTGGPPAPPGPGTPRPATS
ncbi:hypothetical protein [Nocardioides sp. CFH 31398]|uniref:arsenate reductase/protein-tyrosine-phosphatase family protein n=1 Tax=Nocardioides sp. CFH 31398 TaxID=2919579 RepID=UPI0027DF541E|nr:hypothetical protein [Nocardioides sp. CFH 31398]